MTQPREKSGRDNQRAERSTTKALIKRLAKTYNIESIFGVPFKIDGRYYGSISLLSDSENPIDSEEKKKILLL